jgi:hypothetical protein
MAGHGITWHYVLKFIITGENFDRSVTDGPVAPINFKPTS